MHFPAINIFGVGRTLTNERASFEGDCGEESAEFWEALTKG